VRQMNLAGIGISAGAACQSGKVTPSPILQAMGYRDRYLLLIVFEEAIILATLGFIPGLGLALGQYALIRNVAALPIGMTFSRFAFVFFLTLVMCIVSGMIATRKVQAADPADSF